MDTRRRYDNNNESQPVQTIKEKRQQFEKILTHYLESNPHIRTGRRSEELEIRFGTNTRLSNPISKIDYNNVVKQLFACGFKCDNIEGIQLLRIQNEYIDSRTGQTKMSNIRAEICGKDLIREYCRTNSIDSLINMPSTTFNKLKFTQKMNATTKSGELIKKLDMDDFNFRVSYQSEQDYSIKTELSQAIIRKWADSKKMFRCLNRVRFYHPDYPVFADLSIIKSSKKTKYIPIPEYTIAEANVFNNVETYEIELEVDNTRVGEATKFNTVKSLMDSLRKCIRIVLSGLQNSKYPISYIERNQILNSYMKLIYGEEDIENDSSSDEDKPEIKNKVNVWQKRRILSKDFIGPSSVTLQIENIQNINEESNIINIRDNYTVSDKADGERKLLYINEEGKIYLIDTNMNVIFTGTKTNEKTIFNSLLDGEHIKTDKNDNPIYLYAAFDIYFINKKSVREYNFYPKESNDQSIKGDTNKDNKTEKILNCNLDNTNMKYRLPLLDCFIDIIKPISFIDSEEKGDKTIKHSTEFRIQRKNFYCVTENYSIFDCCSDILSKVRDNIFEYKTDGLIFTPANMAVGAQNIGAVAGPIYKSTWKYSFKWKPIEFNTIDFLVSLKKDKSGKPEIHNIFQDGRNLQGIQDVLQYKTLILRCGFNERTDGYINPFQDIIDDVLPTPGETDNEDQYKPVPFQPTNPYDPNACYANILLKEDGSSLLMMTEENEYFDENMIVEFKYVASNADGWKWVPLRVRYDKTAELNSGQKNYGNAYRVANNNWHSIHNPITDEMISTGKNIPELVLTDEVYYNKSNEETSTQAMRDFHNLFVKKNLIQSVSNRGDILIDYAVGKAGDLPKWIMSKLKFVFGIDVSRDNIYNQLDGACSRYLNARKKYTNMLDALFINGDSKLNIRSGEAFPTEKDKQIANAVFGIGPKDQSLLGKGVYRKYGIAEPGFNISSCQFALHYFFENKTTLHQFIRNIAECTRIGGYFIGTCYDGHKVFNLLKDKENGESMTIIKNGRKIFEITKLYDETGFPDDELSIGYPINVYQESINQVFREYLVNFDYLKRIMEDYGFILLTKEEAINMNITNSTGMFNELYNSMQTEIKQKPNRKSDYKQAIYMSPEEQRISFMNRYFIFKKVRSVDAKKITNIVLKQKNFIDNNGEENISKLSGEQEEYLKSITQKQPEKIIIRKLKKKVVLKLFEPESKETEYETKISEPEHKIETEKIIIKRKKTT